MTVLAVQPQAGQVVQADAASIMEVISRAATDPAVDVDKLERLLGMYERITERNAKAAYSAALSEMQPKLPVIAEKGKSNNGKYALWEDINEAIAPVMAAHGFALSFRTGTAQDGKLTVTGVLSHLDGHQEETTMTLPHDTSGSKNAVQAVGSSTSYGKRYTAQALLNLTSRGEDDDGNKGGEPTTITQDQADALRELAEAVNADVPKFCAYFKVPSLSEIPAKRHADAVKALEAKRVRS